ncbi:S locus F-box protein with the low allelic sequence polymorphism 1-S4 [Prunus yedoensis var. nudiflora]|uniref:S locus F-box protein with the low allelic sequence polymorphism 1-S4 n=1 Tax=Prunus yedoensis var. nudiflora TaxID=2094558 RepID=A0A314XTE1_PRUYE|nr:S locus F-box protein with the low allelic sequence polymorphism 1-S4 [Prunus yedoensis var. nudiflora]
MALRRILPRLPSKSLMRFKCVRKSWYTLINNPTFVENHLSNSMHNKLSTCVLFSRFVQSDTNSDEKELAFSFLYLRNDYDDAEHNVNFVVEDIKFSLSSGRFIGLEDVESPSILGHCNGIVCLSPCSDNLVLCNPAIKEIKLLPKSGLPDWWGCAVGFGYDPKCKDYKVSRIASYQAEIDGLIPPPRVEIYTVSTDSWREIKNNSLETEATVFFPDYFQMYFQGICYWVGYEQPKQSMEYEDEEQKPMVIFFDTGDEIFHHILLPDSFYMYEEGSAYAYEMSYIMYTDLRIILWNGSIALFGINRFSALPESYGVWVLDDFDGANGSWTKHLTFDPLEGVKRVLEILKSDEILMVTEDGDIVSYNLATEKLKNLPMNSSSDFETIVYVNSLVSITGRHQA